jgi:hypothetical protein
MIAAGSEAMAGALDDAVRDTGFYDLPDTKSMRYILQEIHPGQKAGTMAYRATRVSTIEQTVGQETCVNDPHL